jgi:hypothetical protein
MEEHVERHAPEQDQRVVLHHESSRAHEREQRGAPQRRALGLLDHAHDERPCDEHDPREQGIGVRRPELVGDDRVEADEHERRRALAIALSEGRESPQEPQRSPQEEERAEEGEHSQPRVRAESRDERRPEPREADGLVVRERRIRHDRPRIVAVRHDVLRRARVDELVAHERLLEVEERHDDAEGAEDEESERGSSAHAAHHRTTIAPGNRALSSPRARIDPRLPASK